MANIKLFYEGYKKSNKIMRVAGFMSGSGTNIQKILEYQQKLGHNSPFELVFLFSNNPDPEKCKIREIANRYNLEYKINDLKKFYREKGLDDISDLEVRKDYDLITLNFLKERDIDAVVLGGYMAIVTEVIFKNFTTINVHPADLSIIDPQTHRRKYTGDHAVMDAILAGEKELRSSVHIVTEKIDGGPIILISKPLKVELPPNILLEDLKQPNNKDMLKKISDEHQNKLKQIGDWKIFPLALEYIARGFIGFDENFQLYYKNKPIPNGIKLT
ncbi:MAG: phosphoribosylglycinamide formyltransferase [Candidatus Helarchaeota archaeon]